MATCSVTLSITMITRTRHFLGTTKREAKKSTTSTFTCFGEKRVGQTVAWCRHQSFGFRVWCTTIDFCFLLCVCVCVQDGIPGTMEVTLRILTEPLHPVEDIPHTANTAHSRQYLTLAEEAVPMILGSHPATSVVTTTACRHRYSSLDV